MNEKSKTSKFKIFVIPWCRRGKFKKNQKIYLPFSFRHHFAQCTHFIAIFILVLIIIILSTTNNYRYHRRQVYQIDTYGSHISYVALICLAHIWLSSVTFIDIHKFNFFVVLEWKQPYLKLDVPLTIKLTVTRSLWSPRREFWSWIILIFEWDVVNQLIDVNSSKQPDLLFNRWRLS